MKFVVAVVVEVVEFVYIYIIELPLSLSLYHLFIYGGSYTRLL